MKSTRSPDAAADQGLLDLLGADALADLDKPIDEALSLPNPAYTSEDFFQLENERLFSRTWMLAGYGHQVPDPGDVHPVSIAGQPLVIVHGHDGVIRVFHNVCQHRGTRVVREPCSGRKTLVCPYHAWTYDLDGALIARPHFDGADKHARGWQGDEARDLKQVRSAQWLDLIFVNISGDAAPLDDYLAPMTRRMEGYDLSCLRYAGAVSFDLRANWKLAYENYIETYHVFAVHPGLVKFAPMNIRKPTEHDGTCFYNEYRFPELEAGRGEGLPHYPNLPEDWQRRGLWFHMFPSFGVELFPDQFAVFHVIPLAPGLSREEIHIYLVGDAADGAAHEAARNDVFKTWKSLNEEDIWIVEELQEGRRSNGFDGGRFSPYWEGANHHFSKLVIDGIRRQSLS